MIRSDEVATSAPAKQPRAAVRALAWLDRRRGKPGRRAGHGVGSRFGLDTGGGGREHGDGRHGSLRDHSSLPGRPGSCRLGPDQPHLRGLQPVQWRHGRGLDEGGLRLRLPDRRGTGSESNEYNIQTAPNPSPAFGSLTSGDAYIVAGTGTAGLIAEPGNNQFGNSTTAVATSNPISPTSVAFDPNGNLLIAGEIGTNSAIQVVAKTTGTFYGVSMTAGDLYTVADVGVSGAPASAINMGDVAAPANGMSVDPSGNIVVGDGDGVDFVNEQTSGSLTLYGQSIPAQSSAVIAGTAEGGTDCAAGATSDPASSQYFQSRGALHRQFRQRLPLRQRKPVPTLAVTGSSRRSRAPSTA